MKAFRVTGKVAGIRTEYLKNRSRLEDYLYLNVLGNICAPCWKT
jgi:hypothetical protein